MLVSTYLSSSSLIPLWSRSLLSSLQGLHKNLPICRHLWKSDCCPRGFMGQSRAFSHCTLRDPCVIVNWLYTKTSYFLGKLLLAQRHGVKIILNLGIKVEWMSIDSLTILLGITIKKLIKTLLDNWRIEF